MAVAQSRSMNKDLKMGMTDGKYKKLATAERGGVVEPTYHEERAGLNPIWYGMAETPHKATGDGRTV